MIRDTRQRRALRKILEEADRPLTPPELLLRAQSMVPRLGIATVYRTLKEMTDEGAVTSVEIPGQPPRYERSGKHHHHHFFCRACGQVFELESCLPGINRLAPDGFEVQA